MHLLDAAAEAGVHVCNRLDFERALAFSMCVAGVVCFLYVGGTTLRSYGAEQGWKWPSCKREGTLIF